MNWLKRLWKDCRGESQMSGALLLCVVVAIGSIVGLSALRDQLVQEFGDVGVSLESLNQSYTTSLGTFTDSPTTLTDPIDAAPADLDLNVAATPETP